MLAELRSWAIVALCLSAPSALADDSSLQTKFLNDPAMRQAVVAAAGRSSVMAKNPCAQAQYDAAQTPFVVKPLALDGSGRPTGGVLKYPVKETGCGVVRTLNVYLVVQSVGHVTAVPGLPGDTHADPVLQKDAFRYSAAWALKAGEVSQPCSDVYVENTRFLAFDGPGSGGGKPSWRERWTLVPCGKKIDVQLHFVSDGTGTQIIAGAPDGRGQAPN